MDHDLVIAWVPGHIGLTDNERADAAATAARDSADQAGVSLQERSLKLEIARNLDSAWLADYRASLGGSEPHIHFEASNGGQVPSFFSDLPRDKAVLLHRLRLNRWPALRATQHRWRAAGADSPNCLRCDNARPDDTRHFLLDCPSLDGARLNVLGTIPTLTLLSTHPKVLDFVARSGVS